MKDFKNNYYNIMNLGKNLEKTKNTLFDIDVSINYNNLIEYLMKKYNLDRKSIDVRFKIKSYNCYEVTFIGRNYDDLFNPIFGFDWKFKLDDTLRNYCEKKDLWIEGLPETVGKTETIFNDNFYKDLGILNLHTNFEYISAISKYGIYSRDYKEIILDFIGEEEKKCYNSNNQSNISMQSNDCIALLNYSEQLNPLLELIRLSAIPKESNEQIEKAPVKKLGTKPNNGQQNK